MNLSPDLLSHIGRLLRADNSEHGRLMMLEWVRAIEAALREAHERELLAKVNEMIGRVVTS